MVGIDNGGDHRPDVEGLLAVAVRRVGEDLANSREVAALGRMWMSPNIAVDRIAGRQAPRPTLTGRSIRQPIVLEQNVDRPGDRRGEVLRLTIRSHDPGVATDAEVVLGGDAPGVVDRLLAGEHHCTLGSHHEDAAGVHQHRRLGVPVRLGTDVDPGDDDVHFTVMLGVLDEATQHAGHPVEVLATGVHGDLGTCRQGEPFDRHVHRGREVDRRDDPSALRFGDRTHRLGRVAEHGDAGDPVGMAVGRRRHDADHDARAVVSGLAIDRRQPPGVIEFVLDERPLLGPASIGASS